MVPPFTALSAEAVATTQTPGVVGKRRLRWLKPPELGGRAGDTGLGGHVCAPCGERVCCPPMVRQMRVSLAAVVEPVEAIDLRAADGRVPGRRGRATRQRLLGCTAEMLRTSSYRSLKVIDIAREAGTSPATFYQYFADVEDAILVLAQEMALDSERLVRIVGEGNWQGRAGYRTALALTDAFFAFWDQHRPVIRVVDLGAEEGDRRFRKIHLELLNNMTVQLAETIKGIQAEERNLGVDPMAQAGMLVATLANVAAHQHSFEAWGIRAADVRISVARQIFWGVTAQRPPNDRGASPAAP
jgi:AcrR family transcriptional regulator